MRDQFSRFEPLARNVLELPLNVQIAGKGGLYFGFPPFARYSSNLDDIVRRHNAQLPARVADYARRMGERPLPDRIEAAIPKSVQDSI